jgi:hypothetical protein
LQAETGGAFTNGLSFQANYTFQKIPRTSKPTVKAVSIPYLDNNNTHLDYARTDYDRTHTININTIYELPLARESGFSARAR